MRSRVWKLETLDFRRLKRMKKTWIPLIALALVVALPTTASAKHPKPLVKNAAKYCKSLRDDLGSEVFRQTYGGAGNAFGKCVSQRVHELRDARRAARQSCRDEGRKAFKQCVRETLATEVADDDDGVLNAAKVCAAERQTDPAAFTEKYGTNHNKRNAFGKCVSSHSDDEDEPETEPGTGDTTVADPGTDNGKPQDD
jgi:hypothetical protein